MTFEQVSNPYYAKGTHMKSSCCIGMLMVILLVCAPAWPGSSKYVSTFQNPTAGKIDFTGKKVAAFVVIPDESLREGREETLATEMRSRGLDCYAGYTVVPGELVKDREKAKEFLKRAGISGAVLVRLVGDEERTTYSSGTVWHTMPYYNSFWGYWNYGWSSVYIPGYTWTDRVVTVETVIYSIEKDTLIWAGRSEASNPKDIRKFVDGLAEATGKELRKAGLVAK